MKNEFNLENEGNAVLELEFFEPLKAILDVYVQGDWESDVEFQLNPDEVDMLVEHLKNQLNLMNENLTLEQYVELFN